MSAADPPYLAQARLVVQVLPFLGSEAAFALKGGTAINLLWRDMPRLSVDIDLAYLPLHARKAALDGIDGALGRLATLLRGVSPGYRARIAKRQEGVAMGLLVSNHEAEIKIEVNSVLRGSVRPAGRRCSPPTVWRWRCSTARRWSTCRSSPACSARSSRRRDPTSRTRPR